MHTFMRPLRSTALLLCAALALGCNKKEETITPEVSVQAAHPRQGSISEQIVADATLTPTAQAAISPKVIAPVKRFLVHRGDRVKVGQLLATLENSDLAAAALDNKGSYTAAQAAYQTATQATVPEDYTRAQLDLNQAKSTLDLNQSIVTARTQLFSQGAIPGRDLDTAKAALVQAQATYDIAKQHFESVQKVSNKAALTNAAGQLDSARGKYLGAQAQLSYTEIRSPIDGIVTDRQVNAGETPAAGAPIITVMDTSVLIARMHIAQAQAQRLSVGAAATIKVPGVEDPVPAKVTLINPALDPGSTTVEVWLQIENAKGAFKAGTPVRATITGRTVNSATLIPSEALQTAADGTKYVMVIAGGVAHKRPVTIGIVTPESTQVLTGVSPTDMVIATGAYSLDDNTRVKIGTAEDTDAKPAAGKDADDK